MYKFGLGLVFGIIFTASSGWAAQYHVDSASGSDGNAGTELSPWKSLQKVNAAALKPGDSVLFKRGGGWAGALVPAVSGSAGVYVTYGAYGTGEKPVLRNASIDGRAFLKLQDLRFSSTGADNAVNIARSSHITVEGCDIINEETATGWAALRIAQDSHHNVIRKNVIERRSREKSGDAVSLSNNANYNLIEENTIGKATHYALSLEGYNITRPKDECVYNVIRKNVIRNPLGAATAFVSGSSHNLIELNDISGGGGAEKSPHMLKLLGRGNIVRFNTIHDNPQPSGYGLSLVPYQNATDPTFNVATGNRVYNNTIANLHSNGIFIDNPIKDRTRVVSNRYKNNLVFETGAQDGYQASINNIDENAFEGNLLFKAGLIQVVRNAGTAYSIPSIQKANLYWSDNIQANPLLDASLHPKAGSPAIDGGVFLAKVNAISEQDGAEVSEFLVDDAGWFSDGFGVTSGDRIRVGAHLTTVTGVDYETGKLTIDPAVPCKMGDAVSLPYSGSRPDIGAFEVTRAAR